MIIMQNLSDTFILDICRSKDDVSVWEIRNGSLAVTHHQIQPSFLVSFPDPHLHYSLIEGLESEFEVSECKFRSIYREYEGYSIQANREIAEQIEKQTRHLVHLFNVDIRPEQRFAAEQSVVPGGWAGLTGLFLNMNPR